MRRLGLLLLLALTSPTTAVAQTAPQPPACTGPEYRTLDFWVGDWIAEDEKGQRIGTNHITRDEYGDCIITEHFKMDDGTMIGHSVSTYRPGIKEWRQTWVDSQNGYFNLAGGPVKGSDHIFYFENLRLTDKQPYQRMIWQDVKPDSFIWRWQSRTKPEGAWTDSWVIHYRRAAPASAAK